MSGGQGFENSADSIQVPQFTDPCLPLFPFLASSKGPLGPPHVVSLDSQTVVILKFIRGHGCPRAGDLVLLCSRSP